MVDNNSTDRTREVVDEAARLFQIPFRYALELQQGLSHARNRGILEARGGIIGFCDDDQIPDPNWISVLWNGLRQFQADVVGGPLFPLWTEPPPAWLLNPKVQAHLGLLDRGDKPVVAQASEQSFLFGGNVAFRRELFEELGSYRADLGKAGSALQLGDDTEFLKRVLAAGKKVVYMPGAIMLHKVPPERMRLNYLRRWRYCSGKSYVRFSPGKWKRFPPWLIRECAASALKALWNYGRGAVAEAIQNESLFWSQLGMLSQLAKGA